MSDLHRRLTSPLRFCLAVLLLCSLASSCQVATSLAEISQLQSAIIKEYGEPDVSVNLHNNTSLTITFVNSSLNEKSPGEREKRAELTATFVRSHYPSAGRFEEIWVRFVRQKTSYIVITQTEGLEYFGFDKNGRPLLPPDYHAPRGVPDDSLRVIAKYLPRTNETEVMITSLQLQGDLNQGLHLAPHFTVPGDATGVKRSSVIPKSVSFDFASYSPESLFKGETQVKFLTDKNVVLETSGEFASTRGQDGLYAEFLLLRVPYHAFQRMISGKTLTLMLAENSYELRDEQLQALREMTQYVRD